MLMYGEESSHSEYRTWLYDTQTNSWETVGEQSGPKGIIHHALVSLCRTSVLLFGGVSSSLASQNGKCNNETWIFRMKDKTWRRLDTIIHSHNKSDYVTPRCRHVATVVHSPNSTCICKESITVYGGFYDNQEQWTSTINYSLNDLWLLRCKDDVSLVYEWILLDKNSPKLISPAIISVFGNTVVYAYGEYLTNTPVTLKAREVWSYRVSTAWWKRYFNLSDKLRYSSLATYFSNSNKSCHFLVLCCCYGFSYPLVAFDLDSEEWSHIENPNFVLPTVTARRVIITKVGNYGIIFSRQLFAPSNLNQMSLLMLSDDDSQWSIVKMPLPKLSTVKPRVLSTGDFMQKQQEILLYGAVTLDVINDESQLKLDHHLYQLDLKTLQWSTEMLGSSDTTKLYFEAFCTATVLFDSILVVYGGLMHTYSYTSKGSLYALHDVEPLNDVWGYYNQMTARLWIKYSTKGKKPSGRIFHAATAIDAQTMVIDIWRN